MNREKKKKESRSTRAATAPAPVPPIRFGSAERSGKQNKERRLRFLSIGTGPTSRKETGTPILGTSAWGIWGSFGATGLIDGCKKREPHPNSESRSGL